MDNMVVTLGLGALIGYIASRLMDVATGWFYSQQNNASRQMEEQVAPGGALLLGGRRVAGWFGRQVTDAQAARIGLIVHRALGVSYGILAAALASSGTEPILAGILIGGIAFVIVDEGVNSLFFTPPPWAYPVESHLRGMVGHFVLGVTIGVLLVTSSWMGLIP